MNPISKTSYKNKEMPFSMRRRDIALTLLFTTLLAQSALAHDPSIKNTRTINRGENDTMAYAAIALHFIPFTMILFQCIKTYLRD